MRTRRADVSGAPTADGSVDGRSANAPALLVLDVAAVLLFATVGRRSHTESVSAAGVLDTAWPFLTGVAVGWLVTRAWTRSGAIVPVGVGVWLAALLVGMLLRRATGDGTAGPFVLVAAATLAALLLGWRALAHVLRGMAGRS